MTDQLLTITMPVFERTDYFKEALESALNQTIPCNVIVVDNASSHKKFEDIVYSYQAEVNSGQLTYVRNNENLGLFGNWNRCAELCNTEFFVILCDDDILNEKYAESFVAAYDLHPSIDFYYTKLERFGSNFVYHAEEFIPLGLFEGRLALTYAIEHGLAWPTNSTALRTKLIKENPWKQSNIKNNPNADYLLVYTVLSHALGYGNEQCLYYLRSHGNNAGTVGGAYVGVSRSLVYYEIALLLQNKLESDIAYKRSACEVLNAFLMSNKGFSKIISDTIETDDEYVSFIVNFWAKHSYIIRRIIFSKNTVELNFIWLLCKVARFISRFSPNIYNKIGVGSFKLNKSV